MTYVYALLSTLLGAYLVAEYFPRNPWLAAVVAIAIIGCFIIREIQKIGKALNKSEEAKETDI